jgi:hypothetical protein
MSGGERRGDHRLDLEVGLLDRFRQVADRRTVGQHHVDIDPQPLGMETLGIGHAVRAIKRVVRGLGMEHHAPLGLDHVASGD